MRELGKREKKEREGGYEYEHVSGSSICLFRLIDEVLNVLKPLKIV